MKRQRDPLESAIRRMGEPSWLILRALHPTEPLPGFEIIRRVDARLREAQYPADRLDPSTLHYALKRMEDDGLVRSEGKQPVEVPGPRGTTRHEERLVYIMTGLGREALARRDRLDDVGRSLRSQPAATLSQKALRP